MKKTWPCRREPEPARAGLRRACGGWNRSEEAGFRALPTPNLGLRGANRLRKPIVDCSNSKCCTEKSHNCPIFCIKVAKKI